MYGVNLVQLTETREILDVHVYSKTAK